MKRLFPIKSKQELKAWIDQAVGNTATAEARRPKSADRGPYYAGYHQCHMQLWDEVSRLANEGPGDA